MFPSCPVGACLSTFFFSSHNRHLWSAGLPSGRARFKGTIYYDWLDYPSQGLPGNKSSVFFLGPHEINSYCTVSPRGKHLLPSIKSTSSLWITDAMVAQQNHFSGVFCGCLGLLSFPLRWPDISTTDTGVAAVTEADHANLLLALPSPWDLKAETFIRWKHSETKQPDLTPLK